MNHFAPSILAADYMHLGRSIAAVRRGGADYLHVDIMDGLFVPAIAIGMPVLRSIRPKTDLFLDVHLMVTKPERYVEEFASLGADLITIHYEATEHVEETLKKIKACGKKVGLAINPATSADVVRPYFPLVDMILVMTVEPGVGGQSFIEDCAVKASRIREWVTQENREIDIEVDGGIKLGNVKHALQCGANVIVAGTAVFKGNIERKTREFVEILGR